MSQIPDFIESELWIIRTTPAERYGAAVEPEPADSEVRLNPCTSGLLECPADCRGRDNCRFVAHRTGTQHYRCRIYYLGHEMPAPDIEEFDDLSECMVTLLPVSADHAAGVQSREAA
jgi:hypothetical protein